MDKKSNYIGKLEIKVNVPESYKKLATEDEEIGKLLLEKGKYRHAIYFLIQAMEKFVKAKIYTLVNPNLDYFRKRNSSHSLDDSLEFLLEILSNDPRVKLQIKDQLYNHVLGSIRFDYLHNNLRYPHYSKRFDSYSVLTVVKRDVEEIYTKLISLQSFLKDVHKLL